MGSGFFLLQIYCLIGKVVWVPSLSLHFLYYFVPKLGSLTTHCTMMKTMDSLSNDWMRKCAVAVTADCHDLLWSNAVVLGWDGLQFRSNVIDGVGRHLIKDWCCHSQIRDSWC
jgi:hypothetical protein